MKHLALIVFISLLCLEGKAQEIVKGYSILLNNDSLTVRIRVPKTIFGAVNENSLQRQVMMNDQDNQLKKIRPWEISAFGFDYHDARYDFKSVSVNGKRHVFLRMIIDGPKARLYYYVRTSNRSQREIYFVEKENGEGLLLTNTMSRRKLKQKLDNFYKSDESVQEIISSSFVLPRRYKSGLESIVNSINR